jgi:hypothetical protein
MAKAVVEGLAAIAIQSVSRPPLNHVQGENATTGFVLGTITETVKHFIITGHTEGTFASFDLICSGPKCSRQRRLLSNCKVHGHFCL